MGGVGIGGMDDVGCTYEATRGMDDVGLVVFGGRCGGGNGYVSTGSGGFDGEVGVSGNELLKEGCHEAVWKEGA
jgi:hypothetical protein